MYNHFRSDAKSAISRAKAELDKGEDHRLKYAALELRMAIEAITYDRLQAYKSEMTLEDFETWQPKKVLQQLLEIDPTADKEVTIAVGLEETPGKEADNLNLLGTDTPLTLRTIKHHYDALGYYLHIPTIKQLKKSPSGKTDRLRKRCEEILEALEQVLKSPVFNCTLGTFSTIECDRCKANIRKRLIPGRKEIEAKCLECSAPYKLEDLGDGKTGWTRMLTEIPCPSEGCNDSITIWSDELQEGANWQCSTCKEKFIIGLGITKYDPPHSSDNS